MKSNQLALFSVIAFALSETPRLVAMDFAEEEATIEGIPAFRVPENHSLFLTKQKVDFLKMYQSLMPKDTAIAIEKKNGWEKYKKMGAGSNDEALAKNLVEALKNTAYDAFGASKVNGVKDEKNLAIIAHLLQDDPKPASLREAYWYVFQKDDLMSKKDALTALEVEEKNVALEYVTYEIARKNIDDAYSKKLGLITNKKTDMKTDELMNARRTLYALTFNLQNALDLLPTYPEKVTVDNFKATLQKLTDISKTKLDRAALEKELPLQNATAQAKNEYYSNIVWRNAWYLDRILYDMLEQIGHFKIAAFRLPDIKFLTTEKEDILLNEDNTYKCIMPRQAADDLAKGVTKNMSQTAWEEYEKKGALKSDFEHAETMKKVLESTTFAKALKEANLQDTPLMQIDASKANSATRSFFTQNKDAFQRILYWIVYERDELMSESDALTALGLTEQDAADITKIKKAVDDKINALQKKENDPQIDKLNNAARTLYALTVPLENTKTIITNYKYPVTINKNNFREELQKLDSAVKATLTKEQKNTDQETLNALNVLSRSRDRILYDMLTQIDVKYKIPTTTTIIPSLDLKTPLEKALTTLAQKLQALAAALKK